MQFDISGIRPDFVAKARTTGLDDQGQPVKRLVAKGGEPCRNVVRRAIPGERLILASYCPFEHAGPYREYGPVFLLDDDDDVSALTELPIDAGTDAGPYLRDSFILRAYNAEEEIVGAVLATPASAESEIEAMFSSAGVEFIHARFPTYGCYALRIDRVRS